jgi:hypothetical protein
MRIRDRDDGRLAASLERAADRVDRRARFLVPDDA